MLKKEIAAWALLLLNAIRNPYHPADREFRQRNLVAIIKTMGFHKLLKEEYL